MRCVRPRSPRAQNFPDLFQHTRPLPLAHSFIDGMPRRKGGRQPTPATALLEQIGIGFRELSPGVAFRWATRLRMRNNRVQARPTRIIDTPWTALHLCRSTLHDARGVRRRQCPSTIVVIARPGLVPASPARPREQRAGGAFHAYSQVPKQVAYLRATQPDRSLRAALNVAKRFRSASTGRPFFGTTAVPVSARTTAKKACAHMASVMCRYHPVQLRTS